MKIVRVTYFAVLREQRGLSQESVSTTAETCGQLYEELRLAHNFTLKVNLVRAAVNNEFRAHDSAIEEGDEVVFIPPVAGG